jgi:sugar transferase EpsL
MVKRIFDCVVASFLLMLVLPFWPFIAMAIEMDTPGHQIFRQIRVGRRGHEFTMFKFRTMSTEIDEPGYLVHKGDILVTRVGAFLRGCHLDEIPQLVNVLRGDMSLVGPRPLPVDNMLAYAHTRSYVRRLRVRPGMTGLAQVVGREWFFKYGRRSVFRLDSLYVQHKSFCLDIVILIKTMGAVMRRQGI